MLDRVKIQYNFYREIFNLDKASPRKAFGLLMRANSIDIPKDMIFKAYIKSSIKRWFQFIPTIEKLTGYNELSRNDFLSPPYESSYINILISDITPRFKMENYEFNSNTCALFPNWFGKRVDCIVVAAMCGAIKNFKYGFLNLQDRGILKSEMMDYGALFGGNYEIVHIIENEGMLYKHFEATIIGRHNELLEWGINHGFDMKGMGKICFDYFNFYAISKLPISEMYFVRETPAILFAAASLVIRPKEQIKRHGEYLESEFIKEINKKDWPKEEIEKIFEDIRV